MLFLKIICLTNYNKYIFKFYKLNNIMHLKLIITSKNYRKQLIKLLIDFIKLWRSLEIDMPSYFLCNNTYIVSTTP